MCVCDLSVMYLKLVSAIFIKFLFFHQMIAPICHCWIFKNSDCSHLFLSMFPDSNITKKYLGPDKLQYSVNFGLVPYLKNILMEIMIKSTHFVNSFNECLNKSTESSELDFLVEYFDVLEMKVGTRYIASVFLGHSRHADLYNSFTSMMDELNEDKFVQIFMDGVSVNVNLQIVQDHRKGKGLPHLLDIRTCGLHTLHRSFKIGIEKSEWENLLRKHPSISS